MASRTPQERVLATAAGEIGYNRHADSQRGTKYARETQPEFWPRDHWLLANGISYCDLFVTWVFWKALGKSFVTSGALPGGASYNTDYRASKGGRVSRSEAAPGDILVFDWHPSTASTNHVGILEKRLSGERFQTIEGNTSIGQSGSQSNGGRVARRVRRHDQVAYVLRPNWSKADGAPTPPVKVSTGGAGVPTPARPAAAGKLAVDGRFGASTVKVAQRFLNSRGAKLKVDGKAGHELWKALQRYLHTPVDGVVSRQSHKASSLGNGITQGWEHTGAGSKGSTMVVALQKWVGVEQDGIWGEATTKALQRKLNTHGVGM